jgi:hypothetical protein
VKLLLAELEKGGVKAPVAPAAPKVFPPKS